MYEAEFVPALFAEWAPHLVDAAGVAPGQRGARCRLRHRRRGPRRPPTASAADGRVVGLDLNEAHADRRRPAPAPTSSGARATPPTCRSAAGRSTSSLCQSALMFFPDRAGSLREMARVARPGGTVAVQVWDQLEAQEGYGAMYDAFARHLGPEASQLENSYWALGDLDLVGSLFEAAGLEVTTTLTRVGTVRFPSASAAVATEIEATPLARRIDKDTYDRILEAGTEAMRPFVVDGGRVELPLKGHIVTATKPA